MMDRNSSEITRDSFQNPNICHGRGWELIKNMALFMVIAYRWKVTQNIFLFLRGMVKRIGYVSVGKVANSSLDRTYFFLSSRGRIKFKDGPASIFIVRVICIASSWANHYSCIYWIRCWCC
jgi:hypothetical protein